MRVLFQSRRTLFTVPGGDTVQLLKTREALEKLGLHVDVSLELCPDLEGYDLVHVFNLMRVQETLAQVENARRQRKPTALSTIFGLYTEYDRKARGGAYGLLARRLGPYAIEWLKIAARAALRGECHRGALRALSCGYGSALASVVSQVDVFLPNSASEMARVRGLLPMALAPDVVVPNAVDMALFDPERVSLGQAASHEGCVLSVARIEGRKCQLQLVRAARDAGLRLVLVGRPAPGHGSYWLALRREAGPNVTFLGHLPHEQLPSYYKAARVHALVSWMETPGLSSLEAAAMGCRVVVTDKGDTRDYFRDDAHYCDPADVSSIRRALLEAHASDVPRRLQGRIRRDCTWAEAARQTLRGYEIAVAGGSCARQPVPRAGRAATSRTENRVGAARDGSPWARGSPAG